MLKTSARIKKGSFSTNNRTRPELRPAGCGGAEPPGKIHHPPRARNPATKQRTARSRAWAWTSNPVPEKPTPADSGAFCGSNSAHIASKQEWQQSEACAEQVLALGHQATDSTCSGCHANNAATSALGQSSHVMRRNTSNNNSAFATCRSRFIQ